MTCVIVLGCYRTGTSAVAALLHGMGIHMGDQFDPPSSANPRGYFEDVEFKSYHQKIDEMKEGWYGSDPESEYRALVAKRECEHDLWGVKDPKLCLYLPVLLEALNGDHRIIQTVRPRAHIVHSLEKAGLMDMEPLVDFYVAAQIQHLKEYSGDVLKIHFDELESAAPKIEAFIS